MITNAVKGETIVYATWLQWSEEEFAYVEYAGRFDNTADEVRIGLNNPPLTYLLRVREL